MHYTVRLAFRTYANPAMTRSGVRVWARVGVRVTTRKVRSKTRLCVQNLGGRSDDIHVVKVVDEVVDKVENLVVERDILLPTLHNARGYVNGLMEPFRGATIFLGLLEDVEELFGIHTSILATWLVNLNHLIRFALQTNHTKVRCTQKVR